ncbi:VanZ family protein [Streptomyces sp. NPDC001770]
MRQGPGGKAVTLFRVVGFTLLLAHLVLVGWLTLRPLDVPWITAANFTPLDGIKADLALGPEAAVKRIGAGLLLLAPLGFLLPMADARLTVSPWASLVRTTAAGALISLAIELGQTGVPGQVVDIDSLLLNTVGVLLAHLLVVPFVRARLRLRRHRAPAPEGVDAAGGTPQGATPTIGRVGVAP